MSADRSTSSGTASAPVVSDGPSGVPLRRGVSPGSDDTQKLSDTATSLGEDGKAPPRDSIAVPGVGHELGPVKLMSEVGRGAMCVVFVGFHRLLGRNVAVKFLRVPVNDAGRTAGASPTTGRTYARGRQDGRECPIAAAAGNGGAWERFFGEARAAAAVRHPCLAELYHADLAPGSGIPYLVFEYVDGPTLSRLLEQSGRFDVDVALSIIADVAGALAELHDRGVIHRDVKPSNILVDTAGRVVLTDFGLAVRRAASVAMQQEEQTAGTPAYMAPETFEGRTSPRSDVYAMAILACQLLTGRLPFEGSLHEVRAKHASSPLPADDLRAAGADDTLIEVLCRAAHKQVVFRHKSARELARAVSQLPGAADRAAKARAELARRVSAIRCGDAPSPPASPHTPGAGSTTVATAAVSTFGAAQGPSVEYTQTLARVAASKREKQAMALVPEWQRWAPPSSSTTDLPVAPHAPAEVVSPPAALFPAPPEHAAPRGRRNVVWWIVAVVVSIAAMATAIAIMR